MDFCLDVLCTSSLLLARPVVVMVGTVAPLALIGDCDCVIVGAEARGDDLQGAQVV